MMSLPPVGTQKKGEWAASDDQGEECVVLGHRIVAGSW